MLTLKENRFNPWEWNIPTAELHGYIYVADDDENGGLVIMSELELSDGSIVDVQIIGISDDFSTITVSTATKFDWGMRCCFSYENIRGAYLHYLMGNAA